MMRKSLKQVLGLIFVAWILPYLCLVAKENDYLDTVEILRNNVQITHSTREFINCLEEKKENTVLLLQQDKISNNLFATDDFINLARKQSLPYATDVHELQDRGIVEDYSVSDYLVVVTNGQPFVYQQNYNFYINRLPESFYQDFITKSMDFRSTGDITHDLYNRTILANQNNLIEDAIVQASRSKNIIHTYASDSYNRMFTLSDYFYDSYYWAGFTKTLLTGKYRTTYNMKSIAQTGTEERLVSVGAQSEVTPISNILHVLYDYTESIESKYSSDNLYQYSPSHRQLKTSGSSYSISVGVSMSGLSVSLPFTWKTPGTTLTAERSGRKYYTNYFKKQGIAGDLFTHNYATIFGITGSVLLDTVHDFKVGFYNLSGENLTCHRTSNKRISWYY